MNGQINIGDDVKVEWENLDPICGKVKYTPSCSGDSWVIISDGDTFDGISPRVYHIQKYARISKIIEGKI